MRFSVGALRAPLELLLLASGMVFDRSELNYTNVRSSRIVMISSITGRTLIAFNNGSTEEVPLWLIVIVALTHTLFENLEQR